MREGILLKEKLTKESAKDECESAEKRIEDNIRMVSSHVAGLQSMKAAVKEYVY